MTLIYFAIFMSKKIRIFIYSVIKCNIKKTCTFIHIYIYIYLSITKVREISEKREKLVPRRL